MFGRTDCNHDIQMCAFDRDLYFGSTNVTCGMIIVSIGCRSLLDST